MCKVVARAAIAEPASIAFHKEWNRSAPQQPVPLGNIGAQMVNSGLVDGKQALLATLAAADVNDTGIEIDLVGIEAPRLIDQPARHRDPPEHRRAGQPPPPHDSRQPRTVLDYGAEKRTVTGR